MGACQANSHDGRSAELPANAADLALRARQAEQEAARRRATAQAEAERQAELKRQNDMEAFTKALNDLAATLSDRKKQNAPSRDSKVWR